MQHADEAARVIDVGDHRVLGDFEADAIGGDTGTIEAFDDELEKPASASVWPERLMQRLRAGREAHAAAAERRQRSLHHPAVDVRHQPVALRRAHELGRRDRVPGLVLEPQQHLEAGSASPAALPPRTICWA